MKKNKKVYDVNIEVTTFIPVQLFASSKEDARKQVEKEVYLLDKEFLRENASDFIHNSEICDSDFYKIYEVRDERRIFIEERECA